MSKNSPNKIFNKCDKIVWRIIDGETFILGLEDRNVYTLNNVSTLIWNSINGKTEIKVIIDKIVKEFRISHKEAKQDVNDFICDLEKNKLRASK